MYDDFFILNHPSLEMNGAKASAAMVYVTLIYFSFSVRRINIHSRVVFISFQIVADTSLMLYHPINSSF